MRIFYNLGILLLTGFIHAAAFFHPKARLWVQGRRGWRERLSVAMQGLEGHQMLWMHVSSLGEFEQGRPVIEQFRETFPQWKIVLTFFSPSGYEIRKNYPLADVVAYLPADTPKNSRDFVEIVSPDAAIFVKYDFWANYLFQLRQRKTPTLLVSALFRPSQVFFKRYGGLWRSMLGCFTHIFVQDDDSEKLLKKIDIQDVTVGGDTRVDRVLRIAAEVYSNPLVEAYANGNQVLIAGSTWEADEVLLHRCWQSPVFTGFRLIIAPHDPAERNIARIEALFKDTVRYSALPATTHPVPGVLLVDNVGMLNTLYQYGFAAYIGGGFGKGIHNTLEPAAFGLPVFFGPKYEKFEEARQFVAHSGAFVVRHENDLLAAFQHIQTPLGYKIASEALQGYLQERRGATRLVIQWLKEYFRQ